MSRIKHYLLGFSILILNCSALADYKIVWMEIVNHTLFDLNLKVSNTNLIRDNMSYFNNVVIQSGGGLAHDIDTDGDTINPSRVFKFQLSASLPEDKNIVIVSLDSTYKGNKSCNYLTYSKNDYDGLYDLSGVLCKAGDASGVLISYAKNPQFDLNITNNSGSSLRLIGDQLNPNNSNAYNPMPPNLLAAYSDSPYSFSFFPLQSNLTQNKQTATIAYGIDDDQYCLITYSWLIGADNATPCDVTVEPHNVAGKEKNIYCQKTSAEKTSSAICQADVKIDYTYHPANTSQVTLNNNTGYAMNLISYDPKAGDFDKYEPDPHPPFSIESGTPTNFTYQQTDGADGVLLYGLNNDMACKVTYNNTGSVCNATTENRVSPAKNNNPVMLLDCTADKRMENGICYFNVNFDLKEYKDRSVSINLNNFKTENGDFANLKLEQVLPASTDYSAAPADITDEKSSFIYALAAGLNPGSEGSVVYRYTPDANKPNDYTDCSIHYNWQYETGCTVDAKPQKVGNPSKVLNCALASSPQIKQQNCSASVAFSDERNIPGSYNVSIYNTMSVEANFLDKTPPDNHYLPAPPKTIRPGKTENFSYINDYAVSDNNIAYGYQFGSANYGCQFSYKWDDGSKLCVASAKMRYLHSSCYVCQTNFPPVNGVCNFQFSIGGQVCP